MLAIAFFAGPVLFYRHADCGVDNGRKIAIPEMRRRSLACRRSGQPDAEKLVTPDQTTPRWALEKQGMLGEFRFAQRAFSFATAKIANVITATCPAWQGFAKPLKFDTCQNIQEPNRASRRRCQEAKRRVDHSCAKF